MPRTKQVAACLFCDKLPCECNGPKKERKPRAKKADATQVRPEEEVILGSNSPLSPDSDGSVGPSSSVLQREDVPQSLSPTPRKRARFSRAVRDEAREHDSELGPAVGQELPFDEEAVAIRNLARGGLLHPREVKRYAGLINTTHPNLTRRVEEWRKRRATE